MTRFSFNPIAIKEMRTRMRGPRTSLLLTGYLLLLAIVIYVVYIRSGGGSTYSYGQTPGSSTDLGPTVSYQIGQNIFIGIFLFLLLVVSVVTPAITAGSVSREVESRTYDLLMVTPAYGRPMAFGKLFAALAFMVCMLITALPLICVVFVFGGVTFTNILTGLLLLVLTACAYGSIGLFFSAWLRRTAAALTLTYSLILILTAGTWLLSSSLVSLINLDEKSSQAANTTNVPPNADPAFNLPKRLLVVNPLAAVGSILAPNTPYRPASGEDLQLFPNSALFGGDVTHYYLSSNNRFGRNVSDAMVASTPPLWSGYLLVYTIVSLFFLMLTLVVMKTYRRPRRRKAATRNSGSPPPDAITNTEPTLVIENPPIDEPPTRRAAQG